MRLIFLSFLFVTTLANGQSAGWQVINNDTYFHFQLPKGYDKSYTLQIYNFMGRKVSETNAITQRVSFSLDGYYRGVYIFQLRDQYGKIVDSGKFQVVKF